MKTIWTLICTLCFVLMFHGCDVPYSGGFGPGDLDRLIEEQGQDTICLADGFDTVCIKTITGPRGLQGESIVGPPGRDGRDGRDGKTIITLRSIESVVYILPKSRGLIYILPRQPVPEIESIIIDIDVPLTEDIVEITPAPEEVVITPDDDGEGGVIEIKPDPDAEETVIEVKPPVKIEVEIGEPVTKDMVEITPAPEEVVIIPDDEGGVIEIMPDPDAEETTVTITPPVQEPPPVVEKPPAEKPDSEPPPVVVEKPPIVEQPQTLDPNEIWHVMYRNDSGQVTVFVYPRCFNNPYHNPPRPPCAIDYGIDEDTFFQVSPEFSIELQGTLEDVNYLLDLKLTEDNARLVQVGGVQGVVN